jgi:DNA-binding response OmpR family regulator
MSRDVSECVLVCAPSPQAQRALRATLRNAGYEVMTATTAAQALELTRAAPPRAVMKPFRPGAVVARLAARLRAAPSHLRVMADGVVVDLTTHVASLRAKLDPGQNRGLIETQCGIGYRFRPRTASGVDRPDGIPA